MSDMLDLNAQVVSLHNTLREAVRVDPKAFAGSATRSLIEQLAQQTKMEGRDKRAGEMVEAAIRSIEMGAMTISDAFNLIGQLVEATRSR